MRTQTTVTEALHLAVRLQQNGDLQQAEQVCLQVLEVLPNSANALNMLGVLCTQQGQADRARDFIQRALAVEPQNPLAIYNLGMVCWFAKRFEEAETHFRKALQLSPNSGETHLGLGNALRELNKLDEAIESYQRAVQLQPNLAGAYNNLGFTLNLRGRKDEALAALHRALQIKPDYLEALFNLGTIHEQQEELEQALVQYQKVLQIKPDYYQGLIQLSTLLAKLGRWDEAEQHANQARISQPNHPQAYIILGVILTNLERTEEALRALQQAIQLAPSDPQAYYNLGLVFRARRKLESAAKSFETAIQLDPYLAIALNDLGAIRAQQGLLEEAMTLFRRALELDPHSAQAHSNLLYCEHYREDADAASLLASHNAWDSRHAAPLRDLWPNYPNHPDPERALRVGFVSADLHQHPVGFLSLGVLESLAGPQMELVFYSTGRQSGEDQMSARFRALGTWREARYLRDQQLAECIHQDSIDVLVDLSGHTGGNRLLVFARKPAPVQVTWLGYEGTVGLQAIDWLIADPWMIPEGEEKHFSEQILRLPNGYISFEPPHHGPEVKPPPYQRKGRITFGSFNRPAKITSQVVSTWSEILRRVPESQLLLKYMCLEEPTSADRLRAQFGTFDIAEDRLVLEGWSPHAEALDAYNEVDIALDPFPFTGSATTLDALWMGVPVITLAGTTFAGRHGVSHLTRVGLQELVTMDTAGYIEAAVQLGEDQDRLGKLREELRDRVKASVCQPDRVAAEWSDAIRHAWREWCSRQSSR